GANGSDLEARAEDGDLIEGGVIHLRKRRHVITFRGMPVHPALSINRGFSAPINLAYDQPVTEQTFLARHDSDLFSRWQALSGLVTHALIKASAATRGGKQPTFNKTLLKLCAETAGDETLEPAFRALALTLPSEADIAREIGRNIDPDAILSARNALARAVAQSDPQLFAGLYAQLADDGPYSPDAERAGRRALRNIVLDYVVCATGSPRIAAEQYRGSTNMTDRMAALVVLINRAGSSPEARQALDDFERDWQHDALVMDKWFMVQAITPGTQAAARVRSLLSHPAYSPGNPNRVRALVGAFATANQTGFHAADGSGYRLLADVILDAEARNPQLAARLATAFRSWRSLEPVRREHARQTLAEIKARPGLSADLTDIVERTLG
ncbi:MAG: aminopeptidase N C-terminal domain-containing protein, partial [Mesorhizobium sp.]